MAKITVSKEDECKTLWSFVKPVSENVTALASIRTMVCKTIEEHYKRLTNVEGDDEPDWHEISMMLLGTVDGFMDYVRGYCLAYVELLQELKKALNVEEDE